MAIAVLPLAVADAESASAPATPAAQRILPLRSVEPAGPSDDLREVADIVAGAPLIGFGEGWHYVHEFLSLRNRLFVYLVENAGVTAYAGETGFARGIVADDYVMGRGGDAADAVSAVFYNTVVDENRQLLEWIRAYNARPSTRRKVRFYGIDVSAGRSRPALPVAALDYIRHVDSTLAGSFERRLRAMNAPLKASNYDILPSSERGALTAAVADLVDTFEGARFEWSRLTSVAEFELAYRSAVVARQTDSQLRCDQRLRAKTIATSALCEQLRDAAMADNVRWVLEQEGAAGRVFAFAHNWHLDKIGSQSTVVGDGTIHSMGAYLKASLGDRYKVIGSMAGGTLQREFSSNEGTSLRDLDLLRRPKLSLYALDLRAFASSETQLRESFDAVIFIDKVQPCRGCDAALASP